MLYLLFLLLCNLNLSSSLKPTIDPQSDDELIVEAPEQRAEAAVTLITGVMERAGEPVLKLAVPLIAEAGIADSWAEAH